MGYNPFMPSYPHIEEYRAKLQELIEFGGSDNEENIRPAFQNCLDAYCHDHREQLVLIPELKTSPSNKPDGTVKDSLRMARGYWEAKDSHDDLLNTWALKLSPGDGPEFSDRTSYPTGSSLPAISERNSASADLFRVFLYPTLEPAPPTTDPTMLPPTWMRNPDNDFPARLLGHMRYNLQNPLQYRHFSDSRRFGLAFWH